MVNALRAKRATFEGGSFWIYLPMQKVAIKITQNKIVFIAPQYLFINSLLNYFRSCTVFPTDKATS